MMNKKIVVLILTLVGNVSAPWAQVVQPYPPIPTKQQLDWHEQEFYLFIHFGPNTFTDKEWGHGDEPEDIFNPTNLDCRQWARVAKQSGATGIILTAKHHDGFCLWPSKYSTHTVRESKWKNGKGDVLKELAQACKEFDLNFGVYISPWDRNHPEYGTDGYNDVFVNMMKEIFGSYGPIWELWWDGANGEGPNGKKQVYDWNRFEKTVRELSPNTIVFSDIGPDIRWVGNEKGIAGKTNWNLLDTAGFARGIGAPHTDTLNQGNVSGKNWIPAECDVSIRPGWFYHTNEDDKVKTPAQLFDLYIKSVGRGANFLLNIPPDRRGLFHENDSVALVGFKKLIEENFKTNLASKSSVKLISGNKSATIKNLTDRSGNTVQQLTAYQTNALKFSFKQPVELNTIVLREGIKYGQRIQAFEIVFEGDDGKTSITGTTIGRKRIVTFPTRKAIGITVKILQAKAAPVLSEVELYKISDVLIEN